MKYILSLAIAFSMATAASDNRTVPLRFGVDDAGGPHPLYELPQTAKLFEEFGFNLWVMHFLPPAGRYGTVEQQLKILQDRGVTFGEENVPKDLVAVKRYIRQVDAWCYENNVDWIANLESANWIASYEDGLGREWYQQPDGRHFFRFPDDLLEELAASKKLLGLMFDEAAHMQNSCDPELAERSNIAGLGHPFMYDPQGDTLEQAAERFISAVEVEGQRYRDKGLRLFTEHVFPVLFHPFAKAGYTAAPKVLKESWSPIVIACAMGAAIQYDKELWVTPDLWGMNGYPSHSPEAYRSALLLAYHLGADCIYTENLAYDHDNKGYGSLVHFTDDDYSVTPHGEVAKWFIHDYVPATPRYYTFRELKPRVAIIRQPDACWGQDISWLPDTLFGHPDWQSTSTTKAWFAIWHLLTRGVVPKEGLTWHCNVMAGRPQQVFAPLDGVVVYDHLVEKKHLKDAEVVFLTGIGISESTLHAVTQCVHAGTTCVTLPHLAPKKIRTQTGCEGSIDDGEGKWIVTTDFCADAVREALVSVLPEPDTISYRFGNAEVILQIQDGDPNKVVATTK